MALMDKGADTLYHGWQRRRFYGIPFDDHPPNLHNFYLHSPYHCNGKAIHNNHSSQQKPYSKQTVLRA